MEKIKSIIDAHGEGPKGKWIRYDVQFESGKKYGVFDKNIIEGFGIGDSVETEIDTSGKFAQLRKMSKVQVGVGNSPVPTTIYSESGSKQEFHLTEEAIRSNALKCAIASLIKAEATEENVIRIAQRYEVYIRHGL